MLQDPQTPAKILFLDIETAPSLGWVWGKWQQNVIDFKKDWYMLSFAYKWANEDQIHVKGLIDYPGYKRHTENDKALAKDLWKLLDEADIIIAQNGDSFDIPKINTRFLIHGLQPPSPYKTVDTLKIAKKRFAFDSNKLDDLGHYLNIGRKLPHTGFHLWKGCMSGNPEAWKTMKEYNAHDIDLLEQLYYKVRAWDTQHPQVNQGATANEACPKCSSGHVQKRGFSYTLLRRKQRYQCLNCRTWYEGSAKKV
jgi:uncharacterized protein YprB with RNaseH-like and TPR domain